MSNPYLISILKLALPSWGRLRRFPFGSCVRREAIKCRCSVLWRRMTSEQRERPWQYNWSWSRSLRSPYRLSVSHCSAISKLIPTSWSARSILQTRRISISAFHCLPSSCWSFGSCRCRNVCRSNVQHRLRGELHFRSGDDGFLRPAFSETDLRRTAFANRPMLAIGIGATIVLGSLFIGNLEGNITKVTGKSGQSARCASLFAILLCIVCSIGPALGRMDRLNLRTCNRFRRRILRSDRPVLASTLRRRSSNVRNGNCHPNESHHTTTISTCQRPNQLSVDRTGFVGSQYDDRMDSLQNDRKMQTRNRNAFDFLTQQTTGAASAVSSIDLDVDGKRNRVWFSQTLFSMLKRNLHEGVST